MHHRLREQIVQYENHASSIFAGNLIASLMLVFLLNPVTSTAIALSWLSLHIIFNLVRFIICLRHRKTTLQTEPQIKSRYHHYFKMVVVSGLIWGLSAFMLFPETESEYQLLYMLIIVGFTATAISLINTLPKAYPTLILIIFAFIFIRLASITTQFTISLTLVLSIFVLFMLIAANNFRSNLIESIVLRMKLQQQAIQDVLTGIYNRRYFMEQLNTEWNRAIRHQHPITIILIDIDHFKKINDKYGHQQGDECLIIFAQLLHENIQRAGEFVARIGGEEFAIVLPDTTNKAAIKLADNLQTQINSAEFKDKKHQEKFNITVSMGIGCTTPNTGSDCEKLFMSTDQALYEAKESGRNCYKIADINCG